MPSRLRQVFEAKADAPSAGDVPPQGPFAGVVAEDALTVDQKVHIVLDDIAPALRHGAPARWQPRNDTQPWPKRGDWCLVSIDQRQEPTILVWWPYE